MQPAEKRSILNPMGLPKAYKNLRRMQQILTVLARHGFSQVIETIGLAKYLPFTKRAADGEPTTKKSISARLCLAFEELGPTFVKLGQLFASRPDILTPEFSKAFERLRDDARPLPVEQIRAEIERELEEKIENLYATFDDEPMAAASVAQVHCATTHEGEKVVVKVQRPGIQKKIETDLSILFLLAKLTDRYVPELQNYNPVGIVDEFSRTIKSATDFIEEGRNIDEIAENFSDQDDVVIPTIQWELTSKRVLTMEHIEGIPLHEVERLRSEGYDLERICTLGVDAFFRQVFIHGVFHADMHGGNIFVLPRNRIALVDFGEVGRLGSNSQTSIANIFVSLATQDFHSLAREYLDLGSPQRVVEIGRFADDLEKFLGPIFRRKLPQMKMGEVFTQAADIASKHQIRLPRDLVLIGRVVMTVEGLLYQLDPNFNVLEHGARCAKELVKKRLRPDRLAKDLVWNLRDLGELTRDLPTQLKYLLQKLSNNELSLRLDLQHLGRGIQEIDRASNRVAFSIVIGGLIIGSSILTFADRGPRYLNMPILGLAGYLLAGILGLGLLVSILRSRKL